MLLTKESEISKRRTGLLDRNVFWIARQWMQCCSGIGGKIQITLSRAFCIGGGASWTGAVIAGSGAHAPPEQGKKRLKGWWRRREQ